MVRVGIRDLAELTPNENDVVHEVRTASSDISGLDILIHKKGPSKPSRRYLIVVNHYPGTGPEELPYSLGAAISSTRGQGHRGML